jgi:hypothetical protein
MQNASWRWRCHSNTLPQTLNFLSPLMPLILMSEGSCSKNLAIIDSTLVFFPANSQTQNYVTPLSTVNYLPLRQQSIIFVIFVKVALSNFGLTIKHLLPPILYFIQKTAPFDVYFRIQCTVVVSARLEKGCC